MASQKRKRRIATRHREDRDKEEKKYFPSGIAATVRAIQQFWPALLDSAISKTLNRDELFAISNFKDVYLDVADIYPGIKKKSLTDSSIKGMLGDIGRGEGDISFYQLRAFANYVGLPTGLFLLFTQMVSEDRRERVDGRDPREKIQRLILGMRRVADAAELYLGSWKDGDQLFAFYYDPNNKTYLADVRVLKLFSEAFEMRRFEELPNSASDALPKRPSSDAV